VEVVLVGSCPVDSRQGVSCPDAEKDELSRMRDSENSCYMLTVFLTSSKSSIRINSLPTSDGGDR